MLNSGEPRRHRVVGSAPRDRELFWPHKKISARRQNQHAMARALPGKNHPSRAFCNRNAFAITETELKLMAAPAMIGLRSKPKNG